MGMFFIVGLSMLMDPEDSSTCIFRPAVVLRRPPVPVSARSSSLHLQKVSNNAAIMTGTSTFLFIFIPLPVNNRKILHFQNTISLV